MRQIEHVDHQPEITDLENPPLTTSSNTRVRYWVSPFVSHKPQPKQSDRITIEEIPDTEIQKTESKEPAPQKPEPKKPHLLPKINVPGGLQLRLQKQANEHKSSQNNSNTAPSQQFGKFQNRFKGNPNIQRLKNAGSALRRFKSFIEKGAHVILPTNNQSGNTDPNKDKRVLSAFNS